MRPSAPAATIWLPVQVTKLKGVEPAPEFCNFQVTPSGEVNTVPVVPTATHWVPAQATEVSECGVMPFCRVQTAPSGEVMRMRPPPLNSPTAVNLEPLQATEAVWA